MSDNIEPVIGQKHPGGRPLKFKSVEELQKKIDAYFAECLPHPIEVTDYKWHTIEETYEDDKGEQHTRTVNDYSRLPETITHFGISERISLSITGLALALDTSRRTLLDYEERKYDLSPEDDDYDPLSEQFSHTIKRAKARIEHDVQLNLNSSAVAGTIFNLKNNFGWIDKQIEEGTQELIITTRRHKKDK